MENFRACDHRRGFGAKGRRRSWEVAPRPTQSVEAVVLIAARSEGGAHVNARVQTAVQRGRERRGLIQLAKACAQLVYPKSSS